MTFRLSAVASALTLAGILPMVAVSAPTESAEPDLAGLERITILGSAAAVDALPGSGYYMSAEELARFNFTDIHRALAQVPGVYVLEEDGYGLRANIGMRGTGTSRSDKITVMEDGVLAAPAPYASPAAYYFPTFGRIQALEVIKGGASVAYGPRTTGGVLNLVSRAIPDASLAGQWQAAMGSDGYGKLHGWVGGSSERFGAVVEGYRQQADGFKTLPNGADTGFYKNDFLMKAAALLDASGRHRLHVKLKYSDEVSDETYLGLTAADFEATPYRRYGASQLDQMTTAHRQFQVGYDWTLRSGSTLRATAYRNEFDRNWYKVSSVNGADLGDGAEAIASAFDANPQGSLTLDVKANNRSYVSEGVQAQFEQALGAHRLVVGARVHEDAMDRFQWVDVWQLNSDYRTQLQSAGVPGTDSNRIDSAEATAFFSQIFLDFGALNVEAGVRYENIDTRRRDWGKTNPGRDVEPTVRANSTSEILPALGFTYRLTDAVVLLAGVQKGFAPASPGNLEQENEESINWEFGARYRSGALSGEVIGFRSDYDNMHGNCTAAQGCDLNTIDTQYNAGEVRVQGLEVLGEYGISLAQSELILGASATFTDSEFKNSFNSNLGTWGSVVAGDELPYQADTQYQLSARYLAGAWELNAQARYVGDMRTQAGQGAPTAAQEIAARTVVDLTLTYAIDQQQQVRAGIDNVLDETYMVNRTNGGIQVGKPRTAFIQYNYRF
ncbi:MAG TPA: TonB-dependent receptor [Pseudidiomarina sp.]|nr:TonB-dependent receptor [Pseudidiomarina sp.]